MKRFKVELTEEQYNCLCMFLGYEWSNTSDKVELEVKDAVFEAERIKEKVWLPFTTLKDGGVYLTRDGETEVKVKLKVGCIGLTYPYVSDGGKSTMTWTAEGCYDLCSGVCDYDLLLELQPSEEKTTA